MITAQADRPEKRVRRGRWDVPTLPKPPRRGYCPIQEVRARSLTREGIREVPGERVYTFGIQTTRAAEPWSNVFVMPDVQNL